MTYATGFQNTNLFYIKQLLSDTSGMWGSKETEGDANGRLGVDVRIGLIEDPAGFVKSGNLPSPGKQMDPSENLGTRGIFFHAVLSSWSATTYGEPGGNWICRPYVNEIGIMKPGAKAVILTVGDNITTTRINSGAALAIEV